MNIHIYMYMLKIVDAKNREENDNDGFLFRVKGSVGNWRVVKFRKTKIN